MDTGSIIALVIIFFVVLAVVAPERSKDVIIKGSSRWWFASDYDNTDDVANKERSGVRIWTDPATGVQYIVTFTGGITPRIGLDGKPKPVVEKE